MRKRMMVVVTMAGALLVLLLLSSAPALADQHEVECYSCHTDGSQGAAGVMMALPDGHPAAAGDDAYTQAAALPATGLMALAPALGLLAAGAGVMIYRRR